MHCSYFTFLQPILDIFQANWGSAAFVYTTSGGEIHTVGSRAIADIITDQQNIIMGHTAFRYNPAGEGSGRPKEKGLEVVSFKD